jgi:ribosomal protein S18 acetylase RimI-like enzyme
VIDQAEAEAIERATLAALPPRVVVEDDGWLLLANDGAIGRANSVLPLRAGGDPLADKIDRALTFYAAHGLPPQFRLSPWAEPQGLAEALAALGFAPSEETLVMTAGREAVARRLAGIEPAAEAVAVDEAWMSLFLHGADPRLGRLRALTVRRGEGARFAEVRLDGAPRAVGAAGALGDWTGIHGMRTDPGWRRHGLALRVLARLIGSATTPKLFLQVEAANGPARALYARLGFLETWTYAYWRREPYG